MSRKSTIITAVGAALVLALPATALGQSSERFGEGPVNQFDAQATEAQVLRGQALDRYYGIGEYSGAKVDAATQAQILRGQALGRYYEGTKVDMLDAREQSLVAKSQVEQVSPVDAREAAFGAKRDAQVGRRPRP